MVKSKTGTFEKNIEHAVLTGGGRITHVEIMVVQQRDSISISNFGTKQVPSLREKCRNIGFRICQINWQGRIVQNVEIMAVQQHGSITISNFGTKQAKAERFLMHLGMATIYRYVGNIDILRSIYRYRWRSTKKRQ